MIGALKAAPGTNSFAVGFNFEDDGSGMLGAGDGFVSDGSTELFDCCCMSLIFSVS
jgi:hypothetical protein